MPVVVTAVKQSGVLAATTDATKCSDRHTDWERGMTETRADGVESGGDGLEPDEDQAEPDSGESEPGPGNSEADRTDRETARPKPDKAERALVKRRGRYPWASFVTETFPKYADLMYHAVHPQMRRYRRYGRAHMNWFRVTGLVEIVLSVSFPFVVALLNEIEYRFENVLLSGLSVGIALVGGLSAFYAWNDNWRLYRTQRLVFDQIVRMWELKLFALAISDLPDETAALRATKKAIELVGQALEYEQEVFFGSVRVPEELLAKKPAGQPDNS
ncbi:DUF4231 domain-containing protein [Amycolatopsis sp. NBRC 101858]|uniref:DUF4231 domain-containing protein n=1 Tax=Amycolatopsis sp. NBRC 101858 TaxID=3032200 RepID=UPI0025573CCC|nr:DUF4231 domain-containing protein [Amycolatopsis sp. NBRC 101858]